MVSSITGTISHYSRHCFLVISGWPKLKILKISLAYSSDPNLRKHTYRENFIPWPMALSTAKYRDRG